MRKTKKAICMAFVLMALSATSMVAYAETTTFNITVGGSKPDVKSKRTLKSGTSYDNNFYVTADSINPPGGSIDVISKQLNESLTSDSITIDSVGATESASYIGNAPYNKYYFLQGSSSVAARDGGINVTGKYTP